MPVSAAAVRVDRLARFNCDFPENTHPEGSAGITVCFVDQLAGVAEGLVLAAVSELLVRHPELIGALRREDVAASAQILVMPVPETVLRRAGLRAYRSN